MKLTLGHNGSLNSNQRGSQVVKYLIFLTSVDPLGLWTYVWVDFYVNGIYEQDKYVSRLKDVCENPSYFWLLCLDIDATLYFFVNLFVKLI